jgi:hypothetical protein
MTQGKTLCEIFMKEPDITAPHPTEKENTNLREKIHEMTVSLMRMERFINRFFDPEDLGYTVGPSVRDDAREALGRERVES